MNINIKKLDQSAKAPEYAHQGDAGMDIFSIEEVVIKPGERHAVATGIAMQIPTGYVGLIWDKSGRSIKEGITTLAGVVDAGYRGEIKVVIINLGQEDVIIEQGQKIAQMLIQPISSGIVIEVDELDDATRGVGGFGSTGLK